MKKSPALAVSALALAGLTACGTSSGAGSESGDQTIAAGFYPLAFVAERVAGDGWTVENLTTPGGEAHDLELGITETATLADATLVLHLADFQPAVDEGAAENATGEIFEAGEAADLVPFEEGEEHSDKEGHDDHGEFDPHFWQDPIRVADVADALAEKLGEMDADNAATYTSNAADFRSELEALDAEYESGLAACEQRTVVVNHDAFGYLEKYDLDIEPIFGISPDAEPTVADLAEINEIIEDEGVTTVFTETLVSPKVSEALADDAGVETSVLDPIEGLTDETTDEDYFSIMRSNLAALQSAGGC